MVMMMMMMMMMMIIQDFFVRFCAGFGAPCFIPSLLGIRHRLLTRGFHQ